MKKHVAAFAVIALAGVQASWAGLFGIDSVKSDASIEVKGMQANNEDDFAPANDKRGETVTRLRAGLTADVVENVRGRLELLRTTGQFGTGPSAISGEENAWVFQNAYLQFQDLFSFSDIQVGRHYVGRRGDLIAYFGPTDDDALTSRALDGLSAIRMLGPVRAEFQTGKVVENQAVSQPEDTAALGDINVTWLTLDADPLAISQGDRSRFKLPVELGVYQGANGNTTGTTSDNNTLLIYDVRACLMWDMFDLGAEYAMNGGQQNTAGNAIDYKGNAVLLHANLDSQAGFGLHLNYANASGDDPNETNAAQEDEAFHDFSIVGAAASDYRFGEIISNSNAFGKGAGLDSGQLGSGFNVISLNGYYDLPWDNKRWRAEAGYYNVKMSEMPSGVDDGFGDEIDVAINYHHSDNIGLRAGYAHFSPGDGITGTAGPDDPVTKLFANLSIKFGDIDQRPY